MRIVLDTNILVSALISPNGLPRQLHDRWAAHEFLLVTSIWQIDELERVLKYPKLEKFIKPEESKLLIERLARLAVTAFDLPEVTSSSDPDDNFILATAIAGEADLLVTGDKKDLLVLKSVAGIPIVSVAECLKRLMKVE